MKQSLSFLVLATYSLTATCLSVPSQPTTLRALSKRDGTDPVDRFPDGAKLIVNGFDWMIPVQSSRQITITLIPEMDIIRASVRRAPDTFHCFFSAPQNELPSASFNYIRDLTESYQGATSITCQTLFINQRYKTYVIWVRYADEGIEVNGEQKKEELLNLHARKSVSNLIFKDTVDGTVDRVGKARKIVAAALMVQPQGIHQCALISAGEKDDVAVRTFTPKKPISGFVMWARGISCYPSSEGDETRDTYTLSDIR